MAKHLRPPGVAVVRRAQRRPGILESALCASRPRSSFLSRKFSWSPVFIVVQCLSVAAAMTIQPSSLDDLRQFLARTRSEKVSGIDLRDLNRVVAHAPDDMTVTVEAGLALDQLQSELARRRQWLPIDPPNPERLTIGALLATNASGPRRFGYGTIRDYLIGIKVVLSDGRVI